MNEAVRIKDKMRSAYTPTQWLNNQIERIYKRRFSNVVAIDTWEKRECVYLGPDRYDWLDAAWTAYTPGEPWGGEKRTAFFRTDIVIPQDFDSQYVVLNCVPGGEGVLKVDGVYTAGLDSKHDVVYLTDCAEAGKAYSLEIEAYCNEMEVERYIHNFSVSELCVLDREIEDGFFDFRCLFDIMNSPNTKADVQSAFLLELQKAISLVNLYELDSSTFKQGLSAARQYLQEHVYRSGRFPVEGRLNMIGHSHLDLVYQWDYSEFLRKIGRTHSTALNLMREFPDYLFSQSQLKLYEDMRALYPEMYERVRKRVAEGRWEVIGSMYVEPDCNLIAGESLIRQLQIGLKISREEFNVVSSVCWLPDVFGNAWFMPQILKKAGFRYFITNKPVIWNDTNEFPYSTFWWEGPDGSRILAHLSSTHFGANIDPDLMMTNWNEYKQKSILGEAIYNYGYGDGRGGPNRKDLLTARRLKTCPGIPDSELIHGEDAFKRFEEHISDLPVWKDEIYLETHRGTYTTQAKLKNNNRRAEILCRNIEAVSSLAYLEGHAYPSEAIEKVWKIVLKNQFHDILPGSHIRKAFQDSIEDYEQVFTLGNTLLNSALDNLLSPNKKSSTVAVINTLTWERNDIVEIKLPAGKYTNPIVFDSKGTEIPAQVISRNEKCICLIAYVEQVPSFGYKLLSVRDGKSTLQSSCTRSDSVFESVFFTIEFAEDGSLASILDRANNKEILLPGEHGNRFQLFEDVPGKYAAWDIVPAYKDHEFPMSGVKRTTVTEDGPVRLVIQQERSFYNSRIQQKIVLYTHLPKIDFITEIDWEERDRLLKVGFPVDINAIRATYDMSFGYIERPTHQNTSWDAAKFEVASHMWTDLSEGDYGVSLLNDCKYGFDVSNNHVRMTLLKGPQYPDPDADRGYHSFTYSLYPHRGDWRTGKTPQRAWELNDKLHCIAVNHDVVSEKSFIAIDASHVMLSAFKVEESDNSFVIRVYEDQNKRGPVVISFHEDILAAAECDLKDDVIEGVPIHNGKLEFTIKPYEIKTFKIFFNT